MADIRLAPVRRDTLPALAAPPTVSAPRPAELPSTSARTVVDERVEIRLGLDAVTGRLQIVGGDVSRSERDANTPPQRGGAGITIGSLVNLLA